VPSVDAEPAPLPEPAAEPPVPTLELLLPPPADVPPVPSVDAEPAPLPEPAAEPPVPTDDDDMPPPADVPPVPRVEAEPEPEPEPADEPPVPIEDEEVPPPADVPPVPTVELDWASARAALPASNAAARAEVLKVFMRVLRSRRLAIGVMSTEADLKPQSGAKVHLAPPGRGAAPTRKRRGGSGPPLHKLSSAGGNRTRGLTA
jgi:hypothetical protein